MRNNVFIIIYIYLHIATNTTHAFTPLSYPDHLLHNVKSDGDVNAIDKLKCFNRNACIISLCLSLTCFLSYPNYVQAIDMMSPTTTGNDEILSWLLPNGQVQIKNPSTSFPNRKLHNPKLLGSGGGGAVFSMQQHSKNSDKKEIAVKISWINSADSVTRECNILNALEEKNARHLEHCLGIVPYPFDQRRVMIALEPVVNDATASIVSLEESKQFICVKSIVETMVDMLAANVVTTDVQLLIDKKSGEVSSILRIVFPINIIFTWIFQIKNLVCIISKKYLISFMSFLKFLFFCIR